MAYESNSAAEFSSALASRAEQQRTEHQRETAEGQDPGRSCKMQHDLGLEPNAAGDPRESANRRECVDRDVAGVLSTRVPYDQGSRASSRRAHKPDGPRRPGVNAAAGGDARRETDRQSHQQKADRNEEIARMQDRD